MIKGTKRDLKNFKILCDFRGGMIDEVEMNLLLDVPYKRESKRKTYLENLIRILRDKENEINISRGN